MKYIKIYKAKPSTQDTFDFTISIYKTYSQFDPDVISLDFCFSNKGDLAQLFRRTPFLSKMVITHDLRTITNNPALKLDEDQAAFLDQIGNGCFQM